MIDLNNMQMMFPNAFIAINEHIEKGNEKYGRENSTPLQGEYRGLEYSMPKLSRHLHSFLSGTVIDPDTGSHNMVAVLWHALNCVEEFHSNANGSSESSPESIQTALYNQEEK